MKTTIYNKLVRDNIPKIIATNRQIATVITLKDEDYFQALKQKLLEEVREFDESETVEELADIVEVVLALAHQLGSEPHKLEAVRTKKVSERGGFEKRLFLESVTSD